MIAVIAGMTRDRVIGKDNALPWRIPGELAVFKERTMGGALIMGRKTFESIGKPLPGRTNIVVSRGMAPRDGITVCSSLDEAIAAARQVSERVFIIGGASVYEQSLGLADTMYLSIIPGSFEGDAFFPEFEADAWEQTATEEHTGFVVHIYKRREARA